MTTAVSPRSVTYGLDAAIAQFSVERYQRMIATGILDEQDRVELLEGYVVLKMPRNPRHDGTVQRVLDVLYPRRPAGWGLHVQSAITLPDSQPEPDFALVRGSAADYQNRHPGPADVGLVIEIADSSLQRDTADKARIYAAAGIPVYWVVNLIGRQIDVFTRPSGPAYADVRTFGPGDAVPLEVDGATVAHLPAADLVP